MTFEISLCPREISQVSGNLSGIGDEFSSNSPVLAEHRYNPMAAVLEVVGKKIVSNKHNQEACFMIHKP